MGTAGDRPLRRRSDDLVWRDIDGEVILLDLRTSRYLTLNGTGRLLWERLAQPATSADLTAALTDTFGVDGGRAAADVEEFLASLTEQGLVEPADG